MHDSVRAERLLKAAQDKMVTSKAEADRARASVEVVEEALLLKKAHVAGMESLNKIRFVRRRLN